MDDVDAGYNGDDETVNDFFLMDTEEEVITEEPVKVPVEENVNDIFAGGMLDLSEEVEEETTSNDLGGTMVFDSSELNAKIDIFANEETEEDVAPVKVEEDPNLYNYNYDEEETTVEEKIEEAEVVEEKENDIFAGVKEEETEFVGFTTLKPKAQTRGGNSRFDRPNVEKEVEDVKEENGNSADDFLAQMAQNLEGKEKKTTAKKTAEKKAPVKKTATSKSKTAKK